MDVAEAGKLGGKATAERHPNHFKTLTSNRFKGMSEEEIKEYMRKVRSGKKIKNNA